MRKYFLYFLIQIITVVSLLGYFMVGNYIFEMCPTGETFDVYDSVVELTPYVYVEPVTALCGVLIQSVGIFLFCVCFGILAKYCKLNLNSTVKRISFTLFALEFIAGAIYLFSNNFVVLGFGDKFAMKELWANAVGFIMCFSGCVFGFCAMYYFKNSNNHLIYNQNQGTADT